MTPELWAEWNKLIPLIKVDSAQGLHYAAMQGWDAGTAVGFARQTVISVYGYDPTVAPPPDDADQEEDPDEADEAPDEAEA